MGPEEEEKAVASMVRKVVITSSSSQARIKPLATIVAGRSIGGGVNSLL